MSTFDFGTPEYWRERAERARVKAESLSDPEAKREMLEVAARYERIAARVDRAAQRAGWPIAFVVLRIVLRLIDWVAEGPARRRAQR